METAQPIDVKAQFAELSTTAMDAFCLDMSGMFDVEMVCRQQECCTETISGLKRRFKNITAVVTAAAKGRLEGPFHLIFDQDGLFTFGGVIVMQPKQKILENKKKGTLAEVENVRDAIKEGGNLLIGSWNRVCLEKLGKKTHLVQTATFIGDPWSKPHDSLNVDEKEEFLLIPCEMVIGDYPAFRYGILFSKAIMDSLTRVDVEKSDSADPAAAKDAAVPANEQAAPAKEALPEAVDNKVIAAAESQPGTESKTVSQAVNESILPQEQTEPANISAIASYLSMESPQMLWTLYARDIMSSNVIWCQSDESVEQVRSKMDQNDVGYVIAGTGGMIEGIVSRSDLKAAMSPYLRPMFAQWRRPLDEASLQIKVRWVMSRPVHIVRPDKPLAIVLENMCRYNVRALPVVDPNGKVQGLITVFDVFKTLLQKKDEVLFAAKTA